MGKPLDIMTFTATRRPGEWDGSWEWGTFTTFTFDASRPQPVGPEIIEMLDEAARTLARYIIYAEDTEPELYLVGRDREGYAADTVAYNGENYLVTSDDDWNGRPLGYRGYVLLEYAPDEKAPTP
jgi:hypothetical protein